MGCTATAKEYEFGFKIPHVIKSPESASMGNGNLIGEHSRCQPHQKPFLNGI